MSHEQLAIDPITQAPNYDGDSQHTALRPAVYERVLERFGYSSKPDPTIETLNGLVKCWSRQVGYDNVQKRIFITQQRTGAFPVQDPNDFFEAFLAHGTSGGCWPSAEAMFGLLRLTGFTVSRVAGTMPEVPDPMRPAHGALDVVIDGRRYRADPSLGAEAALELIAGEPTAQASPAHGIWSEGDLKVWWRPGHTRTPLSVVIWQHDLSAAYFAYRNEATKQFSIFNNALYIRRNMDDGVLTYGRGKLTRVSPQGELTTEEVETRDLPELLVERFGLSPEIVAATPLVDDDGARF
jgi:N-hydroxyarylamine O-acetyltransferase